MMDKHTESDRRLALDRIYANVDWEQFLIQLSWSLKNKDDIDRWALYTYELIQNKAISNRRESDIFTEVLGRIKRGEQPPVTLTYQ